MATYHANRQCRYESFLANVQEYEDIAIRRCLPAALAQMTELVKEAGAVIDACQDVVNENGKRFFGATARDNWNGKSLPKLRKLYKTVRDIQTYGRPADGLKALQEMATELNGWFRRIAWRVEVKLEHVNASRSGFDNNAVRISSVTVVKTDR